jgi:hypothetical protein
MTIRNLGYLSHLMILSLPKYLMTVAQTVLYKTVFYLSAWKETKISPITKKKTKEKRFQLIVKFPPLLVVSKIQEKCFGLRFTQHIGDFIHEIAAYSFQEGRFCVTFYMKLVQH